MSCFVQYAPYKLRPGLNWDDRKRKPSATRWSTRFPSTRPIMKDIIIEKQVVTPLDLEREWGLSEGNIFQGELIAGAAVLPASGAGMGAVPHAHQEPVYVRVGNTSGRRHHGRERAAGGAGNSERHQGSGVAMASTGHDVVIIGGGHNGLITAFYLAKAGYKPLVLERSAQVGGAAVTDEFHPGFRCSTLGAHRGAGPARASSAIMQLEKHGLKHDHARCLRDRAFAGWARLYRCIRTQANRRRTIAAFSEKDAAKYPEFQQSLAKSAR